MENAGCPAHRKQRFRGFALYQGTTSVVPIACEGIWASAKCHKFFNEGSRRVGNNGGNIEDWMAPIPCGARLSARGTLWVAGFRPAR
jgi:hypothetical protein